MNRRQLLRAIALGGGLVAGEIWIPGQKLISIPKVAKRPHYIVYYNETLLHIVDCGSSDLTVLSRVDPQTGKIHYVELLI